MKRIVIAICASLVAGAFAQQTGIPAKLVVTNGKEVPVYLQSLEGNKVVFQILRNPRNIPAPISKIARFEFLMKFDVEGAMQLFNNGDYQALVDKMKEEIEPSVEDYWPFMVVDNNFQAVFCMLMEAYLKVGDYTNAGNAASILEKSKNPSVVTKGRATSILIALQESNIEEAENLLPKVKTEVGALYLKACIERAKGQPIAAVKIVDDIIANHGNDLDWMPKTELLNAYLYMDMALTNSAINTARQVKNFYAKSNIAADAEKIQKELTAAKEKAEAEAKAKEEEEAKARAEVRARARARAGIEDTDTAVEPEAESVEESDTQADTQSDTQEDAGSVERPE